MPQNWKRPLIESLEREINGYLDEIQAANDLDLWEEVTSKLSDVLIVYRRAMRKQVIRFTDDRLAELSDMAFDMAFGQAFSEKIDLESD